VRQSALEAPSSMCQVKLKLYSSDASGPVLTIGTVSYILRYQCTSTDMCPRGYIWTRYPYPSTTCRLPGSVHHESFIVAQRFTYERILPIRRTKNTEPWRIRLQRLEFLVVTYQLIQAIDETVRQTIAVERFAVFWAIGCTKPPCPNPSDFRARL
jgi:hypothetical protein